MITKFLLLTVLFSHSTYAQNIFRNSFDSGLSEPLYYVTTWQDDQDGNGFFDISARGSENTFSEITANVEPDGNQLNPVIAVAANGSFVVVWEDDVDNNDFFQIWAAGFNANGSQLFNRITVNSESAGQQKNPDIAMSPNGEFVVVWEDDKDENGRFNILGRGFNADGTARFSDRPMALTGSGASVDPSIAMADDGSFVVTWADDEDYNGFYQIKARGFQRNGDQRFSPVTVNSEGAGQQIQPDISLNSSGDYVIVWADDQDGNWFYEIKARGYFANGGEKFIDTTLNSVGTASQYRPTVGIADDGSFAAAWVDQDYRIVARQFDSAGDPVYTDVVLNESESKLQNRPTIGVNKQGGFVVLWNQLTDSGDFTLKGKRVDVQGNLGPQFSPDAAISGDQIAPSIGVR